MVASYSGSIVESRLCSGLRVHFSGFMIWGSGTKGFWFTVQCLRLPLKPSSDYQKRSSSSHVQYTGFLLSPKAYWHRLRLHRIPRLTSKTGARSRHARAQSARDSGRLDFKRSFKGSPSTTCSVRCVAGFSGQGLRV